jgi:hypothetical protein
MPGALLAPTPRLGAVFREQVRTVALALRPEAVAAAVVLAGAWIEFAWVETAHGSDPEIWVAPGGFWPVVVAALILPLSVWRGESPTERDYHRAMPIDARAHALARCGAGMVWVVATGCIYFAWMRALGKATGGGLGMYGDAWRWLAPPTAILCTYLLGSALCLLSNRAWAWGIGAMAYIVLAMAESSPYGVSDVPIDWVFAPLFGRLGLWGLATGIVRFPHVYHLPRGPAFTDWLPVAWLWLSVSGAAFGAALWRQKG